MFLGVERDGGLKAVTGLLRPEDAKVLAKARRAAKDPSKRPDDRSEPVSGPLSAPVIEELTAIRTMALRAERAARPKLALVTIVHALALLVFYSPTV